MTNGSQQKSPQEQLALPRVISDFGGRRKVLDRRMKPSSTVDHDRRSGKDRRSGFDRRSALSQLNEFESDHRTQPTEK